MMMSCGWLWRIDPALVHACDGPSAAEELMLAGEVLDKRRPGDDQIALGVYVWLAWWMGARDLLEQFIPSSAAFEQLRAG